MSGRPFDREAYYLLECPDEATLNREFAQGADAGLRAILAATLPAASILSPLPLGDAFGFYGTSFLVAPLSPPAPAVRLLGGIGAKLDPADMPTGIGGIQGLDEVSALKPIVLALPIDIPTSPPPGAPSRRIDIIEVAVRRDLYDSHAIQMLDLGGGSAKKVYQNKLKTLSYALDDTKVGRVAFPANSTQPVSYKVGVPSVTPVPPPVSPGYTKVADILVDNIVGNPSGTIAQQHLSDWRSLLFLGGTAHLSVSADFDPVIGIGGPPTPVVTSSAIPSGLRVAVANLGGGSSAIYVLNNLRGYTFSATSNDRDSPLSFVLPMSHVSTNRAVQPIDQTILTNPAAMPFSPVPLGHPMVRVDVAAYRSGLTGFDFTKTPFRITFQGGIV